MPTLSRALGILICLLSFSVGHVQAVEKVQPEQLTFEKHIRPIFRAHCFDCHGSNKEMKGELDLRQVRLMLKGGESGSVITQGKPEESYLLERVRSGEMPPGDSRLSDKEIATLERWIAAGAQTARPEPDTIGAGLGLTPEDRAFWAFQPIRRPAVEPYPAAARVRSPIDALLLKAMPAGLSFSADADRLTLIKRAYFDLTGLPPSSDEINQFVNDPSSDWYEKLVDHLLDSPHYGERWARHWLDVAGYADSEGYTNNDVARPWSWKYRDYVIRSFNNNKPFDRFIIEQLAGDELAGPISGDLTPEQIELFTATGFLRMAADGTGSGANTPEARNMVMADTIKIVSTSLLGLSLACAQCHDHRYDPIPQTDYYALRAIFEPALDWQSWKTPQQRRISLYTAADRKKAAEIEAEAGKIAAEKGAKQAMYMKQALEKEFMKYKEPLRAQLRAALKTPGDKRTAQQKLLIKNNPSVNISPGVLYQYLPKAAEDLKKYDAKIAAVRAKKLPEQFLRILTEPAGHAPQTRLFHRGDHRQPTDVIAPAALTIVSAEGSRKSINSNLADVPTTGRRLEYAKWLTSGKHPLVARVLANRIWMHHFGRAIVATPGDFGVLGAKPTHPELLDWLADEFVRQDWSLKKFHKSIMLSTAYRQKSTPDPAKSSLDPENNYYWRKPIVRLEAEAIRDRMLATTGTLDRSLFGASLAIKEDDTGQVIVSGDQKRRSIYINVRRSQPVAMMQTFDAPVMATNCEKRPFSTVATQSLMLMNGEYILSQTAKLADRVTREALQLSTSQLESLPQLPPSAEANWSYGYGAFDVSKKQTSPFTPLPYWNGSTWQGGDKLPDAKLGWVLINASGGHTGDEGFSPIRRWTAPSSGVVAINGSLQHGSPNGDGVRGRIVSSRTGLAGEWAVHNKAVETKSTNITVQAGDTIDFITDALANVTSDSFSWTVELTLQQTDKSIAKANSSAQFHGPESSPGSSINALPAQAAYAWELALCRKPSQEELHLTVGFLAKQLEYYHQNSAKLPKDISANRQALINLCQVLLSSNEFLYVD